MGIEKHNNGFPVSTDEDEYEATYVILTTGAKRDLAEELRCAFTDEAGVDATMKMTVEDAYMTGAMVRAEEWQVSISAGDGAAIALNILT